MSANFKNPKPKSSGTTKDGTAWSRFGSGPTLVLLHGVGMNQQVWKPELEELSNSFDIITYDMWGHGESALPPGDLRLADYTNQLHSLLNELDIDTTHLAGHSMGALIALDYAIANPLDCVSVIALNAVFKRTPEQREAVQQRARDLAAGEVTLNISQTLERWFGQPGTHPYQNAETLCRNLLETVNPSGYSAAYQVFANADSVHEAKLQHLAVPALFLTGEFDPNSTPEMSEAMAKQAPNAQWAVITGERHMMPLTSASIVSDAIRDFINSVPPVET